MLDARLLNLWTPLPEMQYETSKDFQVPVGTIRVDLEIGGSPSLTIGHTGGCHHVTFRDNYNLNGLVGFC